MKVKVNKSSEKKWHTVHASTIQDAIEKIYKVQVYKYDKRGDFMIFDDSRDSVDQLYAGYLEN